MRHVEATSGSPRAQGRAVTTGPMATASASFSSLVGGLSPSTTALPLASWLRSILHQTPSTGPASFHPCRSKRLRPPSKRPAPSPPGTASAPEGSPCGVADGHGGDASRLGAVAARILGLCDHTSVDGAGLTDKWLREGKRISEAPIASETPDSRPSSVQENVRKIDLSANCRERKQMPRIQPSY